MKSLAVRIDGKPTPKARPRFSRGRVYTPRESQLAEELVASLLALKMRQLGPAEVGVTLTFGFSSRKSGDLDNCAKLVLDAMQMARVIDNDRQVRELHVLANDVPKGDEYTIVEVKAL